MCNLTNQMLMVFLYKLLLDFKSDFMIHNIVSQSLYKLILKRDLETSELLKDFIPNLEIFLGNRLHFKQLLAQAMKIVQTEGFSLEEFLDPFISQVTTLKELSI